MTLFILRSLVLLLFVTLLTQCSKNPNNANSGGRANTLNTGPIADPPKVEGDPIEAYLVYKADLAYLQTITPPANMRFVFRAGPVMMPSSAKDTITTHWKKALEVYFNDYFDKPKDASEFDDRETAWNKYCSATDKKLREVSIPAPGGARTLTIEEARDVREFLNQSAKEVINLAKSPPAAITPQN